MNEATVLIIAAMAHEMNRAYCEALGDTSQPAWDDAPDWQRESAVAGVNLHLNNPDAGAEASHESWMAQKKADGWVYGKTKDPKKKEHPCMVPFKDLPVEQQAKDYIFRACVHQAANLACPAVRAVVSNPNGSLDVFFDSPHEPINIESSMYK